MIHKQKYIVRFLILVLVMSIDHSIIWIIRNFLFSVNENDKVTKTIEILKCWKESRRWTAIKKNWIMSNRKNWNKNGPKRSIKKKEKKNWNISIACWFILFYIILFFCQINDECLSVWTETMTTTTTTAVICVNCVI